METKKCTKCEKNKTKNDFHKNKLAKDGLNYWCKECIRLSYDKEKKKIVNKRYRLKNKEKIRRYNKGYYVLNKPKGLNKSTGFYQKYYKKYHNISPKFLINDRMRNSIWRALDGNKSGRKWESLVGYTLNDLIKHLEKQFTDGMSWENRKDWHIDHIIPKSAYNYTTAEDQDFKNCWGLKNLQPLWADDNMKKGNTIPNDFWKEPIRI